MARGKWAAFAGQLPNEPPEDAARQDRVNIRKSEILRESVVELTASQLARRYAQLRASEEVIEKQLKDVKFELEAITQLLISRYEEEGTSSVRLDDGTAVSVIIEPKANVVDKEAFRLWCLEQGLERSLQLPWSTTNALTKERLQNGEPEPDGVKAFMKFTPRLMKG